MGNIVTTVELPGAGELEELYRLDGAEAKPGGMPSEGEPANPPSKPKPEGMPSE